MSFRVIKHARVDSTSERAFEALRLGAGHDGDVHVADEQTAGRGRRGARWESASKEGLYMSLILRPARALPHPAAITMAAGLCVRAALADVGLARARLKWPNDVLVGDAKLAGILAETRGLNPREPHCVVGIGVNIAQRGFPAALTRERAVTSLALEGIESSRDLLLARVLLRWPELWRRATDAAEELADDYWRALDLADARVLVDDGRARHVGLARGFSLADGLRLEGPRGEIVIAVERVRSIARA